MKMKIMKAMKMILFIKEKTGVKKDVWHCESCGAELEEGQRFCNNNNECRNQFFNIADNGEQD